MINVLDCDIIVSDTNDLHTCVWFLQSSNDEVVLLTIN